MSRRKYTFEQRLEVVMHYLATDEGYRLTSARFNVPRTQVRLWVAAYDVYGEEGLKPRDKGVSIDPEIRVEAVKAVRKRTARTVLTGMSYSVGSVMRQGSSSLTRLTGQSAMTSRTWRR